MGYYTSLKCSIQEYLTVNPLSDDIDIILAFPQVNYKDVLGAIKELLAEEAIVKVPWTEETYNKAMGKAT